MGNVEYFERLCCPVTFEPFQKAQMVNCGGQHTYSGDVVSTLFGRVIEGQCEKPGPCPLCNKIVTAYFPNRALQDLVEASLEMGQPKEMQHLIIQAIKEIKAPQNYPLKPIYFNYAFSFTSNLNDEVVFEAENYNDPIKTLCFRINKSSDFLNFNVSIVFFSNKEMEMNRLFLFFKASGLTFTKNSSQQKWGDFFHLNWEKSDREEFKFIVDSLVRRSFFHEEAKLALNSFYQRVLP